MQLTPEDFIPDNVAHVFGCIAIYYMRPGNIPGFDQNVT